MSACTFIRNADIRNVGRVAVAMRVLNVMLHILVMAGILPFTWVNGGRTADYHSAFGISLVSICITAVSILIVLVACRIIPVRVRRPWGIVLSVILLINLPLDVMGMAQQFLGTKFEKCFTSIITIIIFITDIKIALYNAGQFLRGKKDEAYLEQFLTATECIDCNHPAVMQQAQKLRSVSSDNISYVQNAYLFVRDTITHSWDAKDIRVSVTASDVLANGTGICWTKSCLLAALLRAGGIPSGISYQRLTRADDESDGYIIHALNTVYLRDTGRWIRLDARGNKEGICAQFSMEHEQLAYAVRGEYGEMDFHDNHADLDVRLIKILKESKSVFDIRTDFDPLPE